jgi:tetratricopeptide (TPR) repeat protein
MSVFWRDRSSIWLLVGCIITGSGIPVQAEPIAVAQQQADNAAQRSLDAATVLAQEGSAASLRRALEKLAEAIKLSQGSADRPRLALALLRSGRIHSHLGEKTLALEGLNQALVLFRALDNRAGAAAVLNSLGMVYADLGESQKALAAYNEALGFSQSGASAGSGDRCGEAASLTNMGRVYADLRCSVWARFIVPWVRNLRRGSFISRR